ncbi:amidohydrolase/deacetylase family metallohydrolase [Pantoea sp. 1.19]|uniref:amidohydrolase/deacetylase family metallohydrolase n=1 Tax=Pantoea sp. 1.19 TaxID=1925589 RepID=UPI0009488CC5|nr:amidohydrolase/deacetylase family metallohydrolase [Pantoea sp. 1.19]
MYDLILRRARLPDDTLTDIAVSEGKIAAIGTLCGAAKQERVLAEGVYLSAGWIDAHVHCYARSPIYHDEPDRLGVDAGVTTVVDAGSTGADDIDDFWRRTRQATTRVQALLNIARSGMATQHELADLTQIDAPAALAALRRHAGFAVGLKARMSGSVVGENGITPLYLARSLQQAAGGLPLMVHIGNAPPDLDEIADLLEAGDILTHCYHGKPNRILTAAGALRESVRRALARGVLLDVGHGSASFSFTVARAAIACGILPHTISSDIYCRNRLHGPVYTLAHVMSTFLSLGMTLVQVIACVTERAAAALRLSDRGVLIPGAQADFTLFSLRRQPLPLRDAEGLTLTGDRHLIPLAALIAGRCYLTEEGRNSDVFV